MGLTFIDERLFLSLSHSSWVFPHQSWILVLVCWIIALQPRCFAFSLLLTVLAISVFYPVFTQFTVIQGNYKEWKHRKAYTNPVFKMEKGSCGRAASGIQSECPAQQKSFNCGSDPECRCPVLFLWVWTLIKYFDVNTFREINGEFPVQGSCYSSARVEEELLIPCGLCQCFDCESTKTMKSQRRVEPEQELAPISRRHLVRLSWARTGLAPVSPFPSNAYIISIWKNNFAWQNTVYGKWTRFSWWFRCHGDYDVKALVLKGCRLLTEITRNILLWELTFIHSVHQVLICT